MLVVPSQPRTGRAGKWPVRSTLWHRRGDAVTTTESGEGSDPCRGMDPKIPREIPGWRWPDPRGGVGADFLRRDRRGLLTLRDDASLEVLVSLQDDRVVVDLIGDRFVRHIGGSGVRLPESSRLLRDELEITEYQLDPVVGPILPNKGLADRPPEEQVVREDRARILGIEVALPDKVAQSVEPVRDPGGRRRHPLGWCLVLQVNERGEACVPLRL